ncbi:hypothetical protein ACFV2X_02245 [Streptomyces sp. NPDC059679]|uniref:hypothetical protein n=1 Tax=Streptomyces sp. NPDC059679 TaxID=3346903 RepID=UPI0036BC60D8
MAVARRLVQRCRTGGAAARAGGGGAGQRRTRRGLGAPSRTVLLARGVLPERIHRGQVIALGTAAVAVSLLAVT